MNIRTRAWGALFVAIAMLALSACAQQVGDIDRTQPNKVDKSLFEGEWYLRHTVADVPPATGFTVAGFMTDAERITWEIQEDFLIARRAVENVDGVQEGRQDEWRTDGDGLERAFEGSIVAAYRIQGHFDVQRAYSTATGEQQNVLVENYSDRPWNQREFMRVDWSTNLASEVQLYDMTLLGENYSFAPVSYYVQETETDNPDRVLLTDDYMEITNKWSVRAREFYYGGEYGYIPYCWLSDTGDCAEEVIKVKTSIMKRTADRDMYEPRQYTDVNNKKFQIFRTERIEHSDQYGSPYPSRRQYAILFNLWDDARKPMAQRKLRPIKYYLGPNFPREDEAVMWAVRKSAHDWNGVFESLVTELGYQLDESEDAFILCEDNPVREDSPEVCRQLVTHDYDGDDIVEVVRDVRDVTRNGYIATGDLRFNQINMILQTSGFGSVLGFAQFSSDLETGENLNSTVTMLYPNQEWAIARMVDWFQLLNGDLPLEEWISGQHVRDAIAENKEQIHPEDVITPARKNVVVGAPIFDLQAARAINPKYADIKDRLAKYDLEDVKMRVKERIENVRERGGPAIHAARVAQIRDAMGPGYETLLRETVRQDAAGLPPEMQGELPDELMNQMSFLTSTPQERRRQARGFYRFLSKNNILHADMIAGVGNIPMYAPLAQRFKGASRAEIFAYIRPQYWYFVFAHEIGHDIGLEHNFAATTDALNFSEKYWLEKARLGYVPEYMVDPEVRKEKYEANQTLRASSFTTLMDYVPYEITRDLNPAGLDPEHSGNDWTTGLGSADYAAIFYAYGNLVQVFDEDRIPDTYDWKADDGNEYRIDVDKGSVQFDREIGKKVNEFHYTYYPNFAYANAAEPRVKLNVDGSLGYDGVSVDGEELTDDNVEQHQDVIFTAAIALARGRRYVPESEVERQDLIEVPFRTCNNYIEGSVEWCNMHDFGVDMWERVDNDRGYRDFAYYSTHFSREANAWYTPTYYSYISTVYDFDFKLNQHKHWINRALIENRPFHEFWYVDETGGLDGFFASLETLEYWQQFMASETMPDRGYRVVMRRNADGELEEVPNGATIGASTPVLEKARYYLNRDRMWFEPMDQYNEDELDRSVSIDFDLGKARYSRSEYDPELGYNYFWRAVRYGNWISKLIAVEMASDPYTNIIGADTGADASYALNLATLFQGEVFRTLAGYVSENPSLYADGVNFVGDTPRFRGLLSAYEQVLPSPFSNPYSDAYVMPAESFTSRSYATIESTFLFDLSFNNPYAEAMNVMILGEDRAIPEGMVEGVDYLQVHDTRSANVYVIFQHNRETGLFETEALVAPTWLMAEEVLDIYNEYGFHDGASYEEAVAEATRGLTGDARRSVENRYRDARFRAENHLEKFDLLRTLFYKYGFRYPAL